MTEELQELIRVARRKLQRASGIPPTAYEQEEERRQAEIEEMDLFTFSTFELQLRWALDMTTVHRGMNAAAEMTVDGYIFQLRKDGAAFVLFALKDSGEIKLARIDGKDPNFANRVLIAIADALLT